MARGQVIGWLNSDDLYTSRDVISTVVSSFSANPSINVLYGDVLEIDGDNIIRRLRQNIPKPHEGLLDAFNFISQPAVFFRRNALGVDPLDVDLHYTMDYDLWLRLRKAGDFLYVKKFFAAVRYHDKTKNLTAQHKLRSEAEEVRNRYSRNSLKRTLYGLICRTAFRTYRALAIMRMQEIGREKWTVDLQMDNNAKLVLRQIPGGHRLQKTLRNVAKKRKSGNGVTPKTRNVAK